ncbi:ATP-binding protein [Streptomyces sp. NPDC048512]|uniref:ATP-binding protein n=1 Tax=unclassified Streptomyces TaxID=2593676 RepID=UPI00371569C8
MCGEYQRSSTDTVAVARPMTSSGPESPADARQAVRRALAARSGDASWADEDAVGDVLLVASELVSNAMLHGGGVTGFEVTPTGREVRLSVSDRSDRRPASAGRFDDTGRLRVGGHGWMIVRRLASDVAVAPLRAGGKRITAVVPLTPSAARV